MLPTNSLNKSNNLEKEKFYQEQLRRNYIAKVLQKSINGLYDKYISSQDFAEAKQNQSRISKITKDVELLLLASKLEKLAIRYGYSIHSSIIKGKRYLNYTSPNYVNCIRRIEISDDSIQSITNRIISSDYDFINDLFYLREKRTTNYNKGKFVVNINQNKDFPIIKIGKIYHYNFSESYDSLKYFVITYKYIEDDQLKICKSSWKEDNCKIVGTNFDEIMQNIFKILGENKQLSFNSIERLTNLEDEILFLLDYFNKRIDN